MKMRMKKVRLPAVAGRFYPADPGRLAELVAEYLEAASRSGPAPKLLIAPHAGYAYSGPIAGSAFAQLAPLRQRIRRVVLLGPSHHHWFSGIAMVDADVFATPAGDVPVDRTALEEVASLPQVQWLAAAHENEHSLEVELPFLQQVLEGFAIVPLVLGEVAAEDAARVLEPLWGGEETLIVVSSDLSHYHPYAEARALDADTASRIEGGRTDLDGLRACGYQSINAAMLVARQRGLSVTTLDLRNSGDTAGPHDTVVGYGAWAAA